MLLSLATLLLLPCAAAYEAGRPSAVPSVPYTGAACLLAGFGLAVFLVWEDPDRDTADRVAASLGVAGGALAHVSLLSLVNLRRRYLPLLLAATTFTAVLATMIVSAFWTDIGAGGFEDWEVRAFIVVAILAATTSFLVPLVERMSRSQPARDSPPESRFCPNCGSRLPNPESPCPACGARFRVEFLAE